MNKYPLIGVSIVAMVLLVLGSLTNVVGYQTVQSSNQYRYVLIAEGGGHHVIMVNNAGIIIREIIGLNNPTDAKLLLNGDILISEMDGGRVVEFNYEGAVVWQQTGLVNPVDSERLTNGNTLITVNPDPEPGRVFEVDSAGSLVWEKSGLLDPVDAERLSNGNTLIAEVGANRVIEVDVSGTIVWQKTGLQFPASVERLTNGNTLITELLAGRVIEVNPAGTIVWQKTGYEEPIDAHRLPNGDTLISDFLHGVFEVNSAGTTVWQMTDLLGPYSAYGFFSSPPNPPTIDGPANGKIKEPIPYVFVATDPENDNIFYYVDWGDNTNSGWIGSHLSNEQITLTHTWTTKGTYVIKAKAKDIFGAESDWTTLSITMPQNNEVFNTHLLLSWLFERFPHAFPFLRYFLDK